MLLTDIILVLIVLGFVAGGWKDGFVTAFGRVVGSLAGFVLAQKALPILQPIVGAVLPDDWTTLIAFLVIFLLVNRIIGFLFGLLGGVTHFLAYIPGVGLVNSIIGGFLGLIEGVIMTGGAIWLIISFNIFPSVLGPLQGSTVSGWIQTAFQQVLQRLPEL